MRIGIDAQLINSQRGMGSYVKNLVYNLNMSCSSHTFYIYMPSGTSLSLTPAPNIRFRFLPSVPLPIWEQLSIPIAAMLDHLDLLHAPANTGPIVLPGFIKLITTIHDVIYLLPESHVPPSPSRHQRLGRLYRRWVVPLVARRSSRILADSMHSKQDLMKLLHIDPGKIEVIYLGVDSAFRPIAGSMLLNRVLRRHGVSQPFVLGLGATDPRKNTSTLVKAFARVSTHVVEPYYLVLAGLSGSDVARVAALTRRLQVSHRIKCLNFVPRRDLVFLYNAALLFIYPSLYEGFGLPVLEAMACGTPVIASNVSATPEIVDDAAILVSPRDVESLSQAMVRLLSSPGERRSLAEKGRQRAQAFSWKATAEATTAVYDSLS